VTFRPVTGHEASTRMGILNGDEDVGTQYLVSRQKV
jgi:hypothetical protein